MNAREIPELNEAIKLLEKSESKLPALDGLDGFIQGIEIIKEYMEENPNTPYRDFLISVENIYAKSIIKKLPNINSTNFLDWLKVLSALFEIKWIQTVFKSDPLLRKNFEDFVDEWRGTSEFDQMVKILKANEN